MPKVCLGNVDLNLEATLDSGQTFGFEKSDNKVYSGTLNQNKITIWQEKSDTWFQSNSPSIENSVTQYFDLKYNLNPVYSILNQDHKLKPTYEVYKGLRLLSQDTWEVIACFIISSNNNIKRIQKIWKSLQAHFNGSKDFFPSFSQIKDSSEKELRELGLGYRAPYLLKTAKIISEDPGVLDKIKNEDYLKAKELLVSYPGIGPKVSDCILLYGFRRFEAFPVDVWILRIMRKLYYNNRKVSPDKIQKYALKKWGNLSGYVQQYLFHGARNNII